MGTWGTGLYSGDFAMDLRGTVGSVLRLPFDDAALLDAVRSTEAQAADNPDDPDHSNFWLVVADQFARRGVDCAEARERAIAIIDSGADLSAKKALGLDDKSLAVRAKNLRALREQLAQPVAPAKPRKTLKKPQPLICEVGDVYAYPTSRGRPSNPYFENPETVEFLNWKPDGWGAMAVVERGLFLGYLAWYRALTPAAGWSAEPTLAEVLAPRRWFVNLAGTLKPLHQRRMRMAKLGAIEVDPAKLDRAFPARSSPRSAAISDITIANRMNIFDPTAHDEHRMKSGHAPTPRIESLVEIMA